MKNKKAIKVVFQIGVDVIGQPLYVTHFLN
jgi:hypothetical protein